MYARRLGLDHWLERRLFPPILTPNKPLSLMRHVFLSFLAGLFLLCQATPLLAQQGFKVGFFALPQAVFLFNADEQDLPEDLYQQEWLGGMGGGLVLGANFNDYIGFRLNALYSQQGGAFSVPAGNDEKYTFVRRQEYLQIPLMLGFNTNPINRKTVFTFYAGGQVGFLTAAYEYDDGPLFRPGTENIVALPTTAETYQDVVFGLVSDLGVDVRLSYDLVLNLHLRANYSLGDLENKEASFIVSQNGQLSNQDFWASRRGLRADAATNALNLGAKIGLTYTLGGR